MKTLNQIDLALRDQRLNTTEFSEDRHCRLNKMGFVLSSYSEEWETGFSALKKFLIREGHCRVPQSHIADGYRLGQWVNYQRKNKSELTDDRLRLLNEVGFIWDILTEQWESGINALKKFKTREGHCRVPQSHIADGYRLGQWVSYQRKCRSELSEDRRCRLNEMNFIWNSYAENWETGFSFLIKFKNREKHCRVPTNYLEDGYRLGKWLNNQRSNKLWLSEDRLRRLDALGFIWSMRKTSAVLYLPTI